MVGAGFNALAAVLTDEINHLKTFFFDYQLRQRVKFICGGVEIGQIIFNLPGVDHAHGNRQRKFFADEAYGRVIFADETAAAEGLHKIDPFAVLQAFLDRFFHLLKRTVEDAGTGFVYNRKNNIDCIIFRRKLHCRYRVGADPDRFDEPLFFVIEHHLPGTGPGFENIFTIRHPGCVEVEDIDIVNLQLTQTLLDGRLHSGGIKRHRFTGDNRSHRALAQS